MEYADVLANFDGFPDFYYAFSATLSILIDSAVLIFIMLSRKPRGGWKFNNYVVLFNLALCDLLYEATTTSLLLHSNSWIADADSETYHEFLALVKLVYLGFSFCTVFLWIMAVIETMLADFGKASKVSAFPYNVLCCISVWVIAFRLAYIQLDSDSALIDERALLMLGRSKAFGYVLSNAALCFGLLLAVCVTKPFAKAKLGKDATTQRRSSLQTNPRAKKPEYDVLFCCAFVVLIVVWCAWILLGIESSIMRSIEVMKSFEAVRLGARIFSLLALYSLLIKRMTLVAGFYLRVSPPYWILYAY